MAELGQGLTTVGPIRIRKSLGSSAAYVDLEAAGDDANIGLRLVPKGAGFIVLPDSVGIVGETGSNVAPLSPVAAQEDIAAGTGGAINITSYFTTISTDAGGDAFTLADGTSVGQQKRIQLIVDGGGDGVLTPATLRGGTTITFADAGDYCILQWSGSDWVPLVLSNEADGVSAPVLA